MTIPESTKPETSEAVERQGCIGTMTAERATYFLERFKRDEKMLGPHEQWALDYAIAALSAPPAGQNVERAFALGDRVEKVKGSAWHGRVVGFYSTDLTSVGYAVESEREPGSVQIYPEAALRAAAPSVAIEAGEVERLVRASDIPDYAADDISHLEGLAGYLDGYARDKGRAGLPESRKLFDLIAKRLREYDAIRLAALTPASASIPADVEQEADR